MSVATQHSPFAVGSKRLYESEENEDHLQRLDSSAASSHKRYRHPHQQHLRGSPPGRCGSVGLATVTALRALFPEMSDKVGSRFLKRQRARLVLPGQAPLPPRPALVLKATPAQRPRPLFSSAPPALSCLACRSFLMCWPSTATT
jgi:hypothetical protein